MVRHNQSHRPQRPVLIEHGQSLPAVARKRNVSTGAHQNCFSGGSLNAVIVHQQNVSKHLERVIPLA
jgi:hypothetical protein